MSKNNTPSSDIPISFNRVLGFWDLLAISVGLIVGAGIITLTGTGIGMTGRSIFISFLLATAIMAISNIPFIYLGGTARVEGGQYTQMGLLAPKYVTGVYIWSTFFAVISLAMYGISFGDYLLSLVPGLGMNHRLIAFIVLTLLYLFNFFGVKGMAKLEVVMVIIMSVALTVYVVFGLGHLVPPAEFFEKTQFVPKGVLGILTATALLTFATDGAKYIINLSGECKNPTKDIPRVMTYSTIVVGVVYTLIGVVASGVLPVEQVADKPLSEVAFSIMPYGLYVFFIIAGALFALLTTINGTIGYMTKPIVLACRDGWLPKRLGVLHKKFKTPWAVLILCYVMSCLPLVAEINLNTIANSTVILLRFGLALLCFYMIRLPKAMPEAWAHSPYHVSDRKLKFVSILTGVLALLQVIVLFVDAAQNDIVALIANIVFLVLSLVLAALTYKRADMKLEYEDCNAPKIEEGVTDTTEIVKEDTQNVADDKQ